MDFDKLTKKSMEALQGAKNLAGEYGNGAIDDSHLLSALLSDGEGLIPELLRSVGKEPKTLSEALLKKIDRLPKI